MPGLEQARSNTGIALAVFFSALALRVLFSLSLGDGLYWSDERNYLKEVSAIFDRGMWYLSSSYKPPGYVYFLAVVRFVFGDNLIAIRIVQSVLGSLVCVLTFLVGVRLFSRAVGIMAAACASAYPLLIYLCGVLLPQALEATVIIGVIWLLLRFLDSNHRRFLALSGCLLGLGALAVPMLLTLLPLFLVWLSAARRWILLPTAKDALVIVSCTILMILPWTIRNCIVEKRFVFIASYGSAMLYMYNNPWADPGDRVKTDAVARKIRAEVSAQASSDPAHTREDEIYRKRFREFVTQNPGRFAVLYLKRFRSFFRVAPITHAANIHTARKYRLLGAVTYAPVLVFSLFGAFVSLWTRRQALVLFSVPILFAVSYSLVHTTVRYRIPTEPCSMILASYGFLWLLSRVLDKRRSFAGGIR